MLMVLMESRFELLIEEKEMEMTRPTCGMVGGFFCRASMVRLRWALEKSGRRVGVEAQRMATLTSTMDQVFMGRVAAKGSVETVKARRKW